MRTAILTVGLVCAAASPAAAQFPSQPLPGGGYVTPVNPNNFMPNIFNPLTQPVSPYMNLLRGGGGNLAADYYYGVRPGTVGIAPRTFSGPAAMGGGGNRTLFFPQLASAPDPLGSGAVGGFGGDVLPPAGHQVVFGNTMGFFPGPQGQAGSGRAGLAGIGNTSPPRKQ
ncbi:MAG TPA: hypothetical protein VM597_04915 [Gemmataceae bacterium]|nr:hypothetical protein [Gemmataceae bacterium]